MIAPTAINTVPFTSGECHIYGLLAAEGGIIVGVVIDEGNDEVPAVIPELVPERLPDSDVVVVVGADDEVVVDVGSVGKALAWMFSEILLDVIIMLFLG